MFHCSARATGNENSFYFQTKQKKQQNGEHNEIYFFLLNLILV